MRVRDVMTSPVITVRPDTPVQAAAALLAAHGFTAAPVAGPSGGAALPNRVPRLFGEARDGQSVVC